MDGFTPVIALGDKKKDIREMLRIAIELKDAAMIQQFRQKWQDLTNEEEKKHSEKCSHDDGDTVGEDVSHLTSDEFPHSVNVHH